jgi:hypothetical protein
LFGTSQGRGALTFTNTTLGTSTSARMISSNCSMVMLPKIEGLGMPE